MGKFDTTLFTKKIGNDLFVLQVYVDDIIFGAINQDFCALIFIYGRAMVLGELLAS